MVESNRFAMQILPSVVTFRDSRIGLPKVTYFYHIGNLPPPHNIPINQSEKKLDAGYKMDIR